MTLPFPAATKNVDPCAASARLKLSGEYQLLSNRSWTCPSPKSHPPAKWLIYRFGSGHYLSSMITLLLHLLRLLPFFFDGHRQLAIENLALRHQLSVYKRTTTRPKLRATDRLLWAGLARIWAGWRQSLVIVTPDTVLR